MRAVDGGHSPWEMNEALELLKVRVLLADPHWYRTMWDDQPATLMWMLRGWFAVTGASVAAARVLVTGTGVRERFPILDQRAGHGLGQG